MSSSASRSTADLVRLARDSRSPIHQQHAAFTLLVERFEEMAFATAIRTCDDVESARDNCQEAFLVAWRRLAALREPAAFGGWLKCLVRTQCARSRRKPSALAGVCDLVGEGAALSDSANDVTEVLSRRETNQLIRRVVNDLPAPERQAITLFYFLGEPLRGVARAMGISLGSAGKRVHSARLRLRKRLPRSLAEAFLTAAPTPAFARCVLAGVFEEFEGEYRFPSRPAHPVFIRREGEVLVSYARGQRNVLASRKVDVLSVTEFDGEGRFRRSKSGRISHFVYYEFGRRLGVARKLRSR
jgi:RNA polymerase sigma-70 factor, ECF subfamily